MIKVTGEIMDKTKENKTLIKVDFNKLDKVMSSDYNPAILEFCDTVFKISSWKSLLKIFYYLAYKSSPKSEEYFDTIKDHYLYLSDGELTVTNMPAYHKLISVHGKSSVKTAMFRVMTQE